MGKHATLEDLETFERNMCKGTSNNQISSLSLEDYINSFPVNFSDQERSRLKDEINGGMSNIPYRKPKRTIVKDCIFQTFALF